MSGVILMAKKKSSTRVIAHPKTGKKTVHISRKTGLFVKTPKKSRRK
jgi:hypothetical protein